MRREEQIPATGAAHRVPFGRRVLGSSALSVLSLSLLAVAGCGGNRRLPSGPPPEYERPELAGEALPSSATGGGRSDPLEEAIDNARLPQAGQGGGASAGTEEAQAGAAAASGAPNGQAGRGGEGGGVATGG